MRARSLLSCPRCWTRPPHLHRVPASWPSPSTEQGKQPPAPSRSEVPESRPPRTWTAAGLDWVSHVRRLSFMAVARKIKTLLTVNILVFVGIILFSVYCRIQDRSDELIQLGRISDQRLRARNGKVSNLVDRQSILQRLERLEDVVYNQLNGRIWLETNYNLLVMKSAKKYHKPLTDTLWCSGEIQKVHRFSQDSFP